MTCINKFATTPLMILYHHILNEYRHTAQPNQNLNPPPPSDLSMAHAHEEGGGNQESGIRNPESGGKIGLTLSQRWAVVDPCLSHAWEPVVA